jgi:hypothetical protein
MLLKCVLYFCFYRRVNKKFLSIFLQGTIGFLSCLFLLSVSIPQASAVSWDTTTLDSSGNVGSYNSIKIGNDGFPRISYHDATNNSLKYIRCKNVDCSSKIVTTVDSGNAGTYTSLAIGNDGFARISYRAPGGLAYVRCQNDDCTTKVITTVDSTGGSGIYSSIAIAPNGFARMTYSNQTADFLLYAECQNANCSSRVLASPDPTGDLTGFYTSIAIASDGFARISYNDGTNNALKYMQCQNADCSLNVPTTVASSVDLQAVPLVLGSDGFARISYTTFSPVSLRLLTCQSNDCTTRSVVTLDSIGIGSSLALSNDVPNVSYTDNPDGNLYFIQCTSSSCAGKTKIIVDSTANFGSWNSLALTGENKYISYYDNTNGDLKLAMYLVPPTPTPTPSQNNSSSGGSSTSMPSAPICSALTPAAPNLFQIKTTKTSATLYFAPIYGTMSSYFISYGYQSGDNRFGVEFPYGSSTGVVAYSLQSLTPNSTYYVRIRGGNGCMPGMWSNEMSFTTNGKTFYQQSSSSTR